MDLRVVCRFLGRISLAEACVTCVPLFLALGFGDECTGSFILAIGIMIACGILLLRYGRVRTKHLTIREGIAITGLGWLLATFLGMIPYVAGGYLNLIDGVFESISGFTGTGATVIEDIESLPFSILFWRSMTHWLGGLGIVTIFIALLPAAGQNTLYLHNAESAGPATDRLLPRLRDMTGVLFRIYMTFTAIAFVIFMLCGMDFFSALNHAMSTISAGGFSTFNDSAAHFDSAAVEGWMTFFMILAGGNFGLYYQLYRKGFHALKKNTEFKAYLLILFLATVCIAADLIHAFDADIFTALRYASFQAASIATTGFVSADYDQWPSFSKGILLLLMISGGCSGSTAAGIKISRVVILCRSLVAAVREKLHPRMVMDVEMNGRLIGQDTIIRVNQFFFLYLVFIAFWALLLTFDGIGIFDAIGISVTTMGCIGPSFGITGATCTYAGLSDFAKTILCISMLLGRLELFTVLAMLHISFWKKRGNW